MNITESVTLDAFKQWAKDCEPAARAVLMARVYAEMERERVDAYIRPVFDGYRFEYAERWRDARGGGLSGLIPAPKDLYLCDDEIMMAAYYEDCDRVHREHGFKGPKGHCPALTAEHLVIVTENALINLARPLFNVDACDLYGETRAKYLDLLIGACLKKESR